MEESGNVWRRRMLGKLLIEANQVVARINTKPAVTVVATIPRAGSNKCPL